MIDSQHDEFALEPDIEIVDAHHHLAHRGVDYFLDELLEDTGSGHNVTQTVYVEDRWAWNIDATSAEMMPVGEVAQVSAIADESQRRGGTTIAGIVGHVDLRFGAKVGRPLDEMADVSGGRLVGIRHATAFSTNPSMRPNPACDSADLTSDVTWREGFAELARRGLTFDACVWYPQLNDLVDLAEQFAETTIVVDHLGIGTYFDDRDRALELTQRSLLELSKRPNVMLKLGGLGWPSMSGGWEHTPTSDELARRWTPFIRWCIQVFGVDRCMFESNFPVDRQTCSYLVLWNAFKRIVADGSPSDKQALFAGTARSAYQLNRGGSDLAKYFKGSDDA